MGLLKRLVKKTPFKWDDRLYDRAQPKIQKTQKFARRFSTELKRSTRQVFGDIASGRLGEKAARELERVPYFKPKPGKVRVRDFFRELPVGLEKTAQKTAQDAVRFGISAYEVPRTLRTGKATGKWYNTPVGRINSFQSEAQNRVRRGDSLWKAIGNPAAETLLAGTDIGAVSRPLLRAVKQSKNRFIPKEAKRIAGDFTQPLTRKVGGIRQLRPFRSKFMRSLQNPGLTAKRVSGPTNRNTQKINAFKQTAQQKAAADVLAMTRGTAGMKKPPQTAKQKLLPEVTITKAKQYQPPNKKDEPVIIDPDLYKKKYNDYDPANHPKYSAMADAEFDKQLKINKNPVVIFTAGGSGAGKSEVIVKNIKHQGFDGIVVDGTLADYDQTIKKIRQAQMYGKHVIIEAVLPNVINAWQFVQRRELQMGRGVPMGVFVRKHIGVIDTLKRILRDHPDITVNIIDTRHGLKNARIYNTSNDREAMIDLLGNIVYNESRLLRRLPYVKPSAKQRREAYLNVVGRGAANGGTGSAPPQQRAQRSSFADIQRPQEVVRGGGRALLALPAPKSRQQAPLNKLLGREVIITPPPKNPTKQTKSSDPVADFARKLDEEIASGTAPGSKKRYNAFQERAYREKKKETKAARKKLYWGNVLYRSGWRKKELDRIEPKVGQLMSEMVLLGYPKKVVLKYADDIGKMRRIVSRKATFESLTNYHKRKKALETNFLEGIDTKKLKDINPVMKGWRDVYRNFETVFGEQFPIIKKRLLDPFDAAKGDFIDTQRQILRELDEKIINGLGIKKGSKLSALVQKYGEGLIDLDELKKQVPHDWEKVIEADKFFRQKYDQMLDELNKIREYYYPTHPLYPESTKQIPKRKDYYRHFREMTEGFAGLKNLFETPSAIDPRLAVISENTKPTSRWLGFAQRRTGNQTDYDAVGGFLDYTKAHAYAKHIDPFIRQFRGMDKEVMEASRMGRRTDNIRGLAEELTSNAYLKENLAAAKTDEKITQILQNDLKIKEPSKNLRDALLHAETEDEVEDVMEEILRDKDGKPLPSLERFRDFKAVEDGQVNNFLKFLDEFANDLAGKTSAADRWLQDRVGRTTFRALKWLNSRIKSNTVVGNLGSSLAQWFNLPNGVANAGPLNTVLGMKDAMISLWTKNAPIKKSAFIKERYFDDYGKFDRTLLDRTKIKPFALWITGIGDEIATKTMWWAHYKKALRKGVKDPIKYADDWTRKMVAGRGIGEVPVDQKATLVQLIAPFQLEVANQWHVFRDWARARKMTDEQAERMFGKLIVWALMGYGMNRAAAHIRGSDVSFDPINAVREGYDAYAQEDDKTVGALKFGGRVAGEAISNLPLGQSLAMIYPERGLAFGPKDPETGKRKRLPRDQFFGEGDPTRFGSGLLLHKGLANPQYSLLTPFGGAQIKRSVEAFKADREGVVKNSSGKVMYPTPTDGLSRTQMYLFGKYATPQTREYFKNKSTPLGKRDSAVLMALDRTARQSYFDDVISRRQSEREKRKEKERLTRATTGSDGESGLARFFPWAKKEPRDPVVSLARAYGIDKYLTGGEYPKTVQGDILRANAKKTARAILTSSEYDNVPEDIKRELLARMGYTENDMDYLRLAGLKTRTNNATIAPYVWEKIQADQSAENVQRLVDEKILTEPLLKEMYAQGLVKSDDYGALIRIIKRKKTRRSTGSSRRRSATRRNAKTPRAGVSVVEKYFADAITAPVRRQSARRSAHIITPRSILASARIRRPRRMPKLVYESIKSTL